MNPCSKSYRTVGLTAIVCVTCLAVVGQTAGTPINFSTVQPGATAFEWVELPAGTSAVSGTVTGPFAIALQTSYDYGSINGISFASSADTNGVCSPDAPACGVYLGVEFLGAATPGSSTGTVRLNNGLLYSLSANVLGPGLIFSPSVIDGGSVPVGSTSDGYAFTITNVESAGSADITLDPPSVSGPFSITNNCGASLAARAACSMTVFFAPTATGAASGGVQIPTGVGTVGIALTGTGVDNPADVRIDPATIVFPLLSTGVSEIRTLKITNQSAVDSVRIGSPSTYLCLNSSYLYCIGIVGNNCGTLAPGASCQIQLTYQGWPGQGSLPGTLLIPMTPSSATTASNYIVPFAEFSLPQPAIVSASPSILQFPATPFGEVSAPMTVTVTNQTQSTVMINASPIGSSGSTADPASISDFIIDPTCGPLAPLQSCNLSVRYVPMSGVQQGSGWLEIRANGSSGSQFLGSAIVATTGFGMPAASIASPSSPPLIQPVDLSTVSITNTSMAPLVLSTIWGPSWITPDLSACSQPIPPGGSCAIGVSFTIVPYSHPQLSIYSNAQSSPDVYQFPDSVAQGGEPPDFSPLGTPVVFPMTAIGGSTSARLSITSIGSFETLIDLRSNPGSDFTVDNQCPALLVPQPNHTLGDNEGICFVTVGFTPQTPGFHTGRITLTTNFGLFTTLLAGTGVVSPLSLTPEDLLFSAPSGQSDTKTVTVTNTSASAVQFSPPVVNGFGFRVSQTTCGSSLAAGATCTIGLTFSVSGQGSFAGQLVIISGVNDIVNTANLKGVIPQLVVTSSQSSFPPTSIGGQSDILFTLTSFQGAPITLQGFTLNGANPTDFKIASNTCTAGMVLQGTMNCVIDVAFAPRDLGSLSTTLEIDNTAAVYNTNLSGTAATGPAQVSPATLAFGNENLLVPSVPQLITLSNPNPAPLALPVLPALSGANPADFNVTGTCATIAANSSCQLSVTFDPSAVGSRTASLVIGTGTAVNPSTGQPASTSTTVYFSGVAVATGPGATVHPLNVHFRRREVGSISGEERVFLRNRGTTTLMLPAPPVISGADPLDFRLTGICSSIAAGSHCELGVEFAPTAEGRRSATLSIPTGGSTNGSAEVSLTGTGCRAEDRDRHARDEEGCERRRDEWREDDRH